MAEKRSEKPAEESAINWPPTDYREWVQTNIANKMIGSLLAGGITMITVAAGVVLWIQDSSIKNIQIETQSKLAELEMELRAQIDNRIDTRIETKLTTDEQLKDDLFNAIKRQIEDYIETDEYREQVRTAIIQDKTLEDLIRERGIAIAQSADSPVETRKLGMQLYGLFQPMDAAERETFRTNLVSILEKEDSFSELSATILELYNYQECEDFGFAATDNTCKSNDRRAVTAGMVLYGSTSDESAKQLIADWLAEVPIAHAYILTNALARDLGTAAEPLLAAIASSARPDLVEQVGLGLAERAGPDDAAAHDTILAFLSWLPEDLALPRQARIDLALWIWNHFDATDIGSALLIAETEATDDEAPSARSATLKRAFVNLLRTSGPPLATDGHAASYAENDWEHLLRNALELGRDPARDTILLNAWALRISIDRQHDLDVAWAGQRMLQHYVDNREMLVPPAAYETAVAVAAWPDVASFADIYLERIAALRADDPILQAILSQDSRQWSEYDKVAFDWLRRKAATATDPVRKNALLGAALFNGQDDIPPPNSHEWHRALARAAAWPGDASKDEAGEVMAGICQEEIIGRLTSKDDAQRWRMVNAVESVLLAANAGDSGLLRAAGKEFMPWLTAPPETPAPVDETASADWSIADGMGSLDLHARGGIWRSATVASDSWVTYTPPAGVALSAFDGDLTRFMGASEAGTPLELHLEPKLQYLLVARPHQRDGRLGPVRVEARPYAPHASPNSIETAYKIPANVREVTFMAGDLEGEAWFSTSLPANHRLTVETGATPDSPANLDTFIYLLDADTEQQLGWNDDAPGTNTLYSRLQHTAWRNTEALIRIVMIGDRPFLPGTGFSVAVDLVDAPAPVELTGGDWPQQLDFRATEAQPEGLFRIALEPGQTITVETGQPMQLSGEIDKGSEGPVIDTVAYLLDVATGEQLASNDDGMGIGLFSHVAHTASRPTDLLVRIVEIGDRPFAAGTSFAVNVDVSPTSQPAANSRQSE